MEDIRKHNVTNSFINNGRWLVYFDIAFNGRKTMRKAIYSWLMGNPQFENLPPGYCIHHLDFDETNDDISNLALMKKSHHAAYHLKHSKNHEDDTRLKLREPIQLGRNPTIPKVHPYRGKYYKLRWQEMNALGERIDRQLIGIENKKPFKTPREAERARDLFMKIHPDFREDVVSDEKVDLIARINEDISPSEIEDAYHLIKKTFPRL